MSVKPPPDVVSSVSLPRANHPRQKHPWQVARGMLTSAAALLPLAAFTLGLGMAIYHFQEHLAWPDAFLNAAMLMGGMGPVDPVKTTAGKVLAGSYALFAGLFFIVLAGVMLAPMIHHVLHHFHIPEK